jgi:hypothetical protein
VQRLEPPLLVLQSGLHDISPSLTSPWTKSHLMATKNRASRHSLQNQTVGIKAWVRTTEYHPIQQTQTYDCYIHRRSLSELPTPIRSRRTGFGKSSSSHKRNPRSTNLPSVPRSRSTQARCGISSSVRAALAQIFRDEDIRRHRVCKVLTSRAWPRPPDSIAPPQRCIATTASPASRSAAATTRAAAGSHGQSGPPWPGTHAHHATHTPTDARRHPAAAVSPEDRQHPPATARWIWEEGGGTLAAAGLVASRDALET